MSNIDEIKGKPTVIYRLWLLIKLLVWFVVAPVWWVTRLMWRYAALVFAIAWKNTQAFAKSQLHWLRHGYEPDGSRLDTYIAQYLDDKWVRIPFTLGALVLGVPAMFAMMLAIGYGAPIVIGLTIDQTTYPQHEIYADFRTDGPVAERARTTPLTSVEKGILVTDALVYQLEYELDSVSDMSFEDWKTLNFNGFWGWTPNDCAGWCPLAWPGLFDNRANRQRGVIYAVRNMTEVWSQETSKFGNADRESIDLVEARQEGFAPSAEFWFFPSSEGMYRDGIALVHRYQDKLRAGSNDARINMTTADLAAILRGMKQMLQEPNGRLVDRNATVRWSEIDDAVFYSQGAAIVARDMLAALSVAYDGEFNRGQVREQVAEAISSLNAVAQFNPYWNLRGDGDSVWGDHRAKLARYYNDVIGRLEDIANAIES